jgi:hypothetical protein
MKDRQEGCNRSHITMLELLEANFKLAAAKALMVLPTQPAQVVIRKQQGDLASITNPQFSSAVKAAKLIYQSENSVAPFFRGAGTGFTKELAKNGIYKGAFITGAPDLADKLLPQSLSAITSPSQYHVVKSIFAGIIAASGDTIFGGFLESWATFRATSQGQYAKASYWGEVASEQSIYDKLKRMYRGGGATTVKGTIAFSTYFAATTPIKNAVIQMYGVQNAYQLPWHGSILAAILSGGTVALVSSPFDIIKTQYQMPNPSHKSVMQALASNYQTFGIRGITAGLPLKFVMITMGWAITNLVTQRNSHHHEEKEVNQKSASHRR